MTKIKFSEVKRVWRKSPMLVFEYMRRKMVKKARLVVTQADEYRNWLGEEMRPFNSLRQNA